MKFIKKKQPNQLLTAILTFALVLVLAPLSALAHAKLIKSVPSDGEVLRQSPTVIELIFNTALQNASGMNEIIVTDQNGKRVDKDNTTVADDGKKLRVELENLDSGVYSAEWRVLSADDHSIKGKFGFKVTFTDAAARLPENSPPPNPMMDKHIGMNHETPAQESGGTGWHSVVRWLMYLTMMTIFGGFVFWLLVLKPALVKGDLIERDKSEALKNGMNRFLKLIRLNLALLIFTVFASLVLQTAAVFNLGLAESFALSRWKQILTETVFGTPWLIQLAAIIALLIIFFFIARESKKSDQPNDNPRLWQIGLGICALLFLTPSLSGHARAASSEDSLAILFDWLHLIAVGFWVGGLFHLALTMPKAVSTLDSVKRVNVQNRAISHFTRLAVPAVVLTALTGIYNSWIHLGEMADLWTTGYGTILLTKTGLFLVMVTLGGLNSFILRPRLEKVESESSAEQSFYRSVRIEALIGLIILLLAAILAFLPPARRHEKSMSSERGKHYLALEKTNYGKDKMYRNESEKRK